MSASLERLRTGNGELRCSEHTSGGRTMKPRSSAKLKRFGVCAALCEESKSFDQRFGNPEASDELCFSMQRVG